MKPLTLETGSPEFAAETKAGTPAPAANKPLMAALLKRVPQDSKSGKLTPAGAVSAAANVGLDEMQATIADLVAKHADIESVTNTGTAYLFSTASITPEQARRLAWLDQFRLRLLNKVREDSQHAKSTGVESVRENTVPTPNSEDVKACLAEIASDKQCQDIKQLVAYTGALYLYSDTRLPKEEAEQVARIEEFHLQVLKKVREDSKYKSRLTRAEALKTLAPDVQPGEVEAACAEVTAKYHDCKSVVDRSGAVYLYSDEHMTEEYARILLRVEANDPCFLIAEMVREDSKVYPRPTDVELFKYGLFHIEIGQLDDYIQQTQEQYDDIKLVRIPDGPTYLYSSEYLSEEEAIAYIDYARRSQRD